MTDKEKKKDESKLDKVLESIEKIGKHLDSVKLFEDTKKEDKKESKKKYCESCGAKL